MCPATGSIGSTSPRKRSEARASTTTRPASSRRASSSAASMVSPSRGCRVNSAGSISSSPSIRGPSQAPIPPSRTATSSWPKWRSSHHRRAAPPVMPWSYAITKTPAPMRALPAARAKSSARGSGWRPPSVPGGRTTESSCSTLRNDAPGMCPSRYSSRPRSGRPSSQRQSTNWKRTRWSLGGELVNRAAVGDDQQLALACLAEGRDVQARVEHETAVTRQLAVAEEKPPNAAAAVVAEEVPARPPSQCDAAVGEAPCHRAAERVAIGVDRPVVPAWPSQRRVAARVEGKPLEDAPAVVLERAKAGCRLRAYLFPVPLSHVGDVEAAGGAVERETPGVSSSVDLHPPPGCEVAGIHAEDLAEPARRVLRVVPGIARTSAVAGAHVQASVGAPDDLAAVVVRRAWVSDSRKDPPGAANSSRKRGVRAKPSEDDVAVVVRVVHVEVAIRAVIAVERQREQTLFPATADIAADVEEERARARPLTPDLALLLYDVERTPLLGGVDSRVEVARDPDQPRGVRGGGECEHD